MLTLDVDDGGGDDGGKQKSRKACEVASIFGDLV
jgi:hypothetical protein